MICILAGIYNLPPSVVLLDIPLRAVQTPQQFPARGFDENLIGECMRMSGMNLVAVQEYSRQVYASSYEFAATANTWASNGSGRLF